MNGASHLSADRLLDLVQGLVSGPELAEALRHLKSCPSCEERFREVGRESQILTIRAGLGAGSEAASIPRMVDAPVVSVRGRRWVWAALATAAAILVVVVSWPLFRETTRERSDLDYWLPIEDERLALRSGSVGNETGPLLEAVEAYGRRDTARVVELLEHRELSDQQRWLRIYLASALLWEGRNSEARDLLDQTHIWVFPQPYRDRGRWISYIAQKRAGDAAAAERIARDLTSRPGEFADRARRALAQAPSTASP